MEATDLRLEGVSLPPCTARSCSQSVEVISLGKPWRTVNGDFHFVSAYSDSTGKPPLKYRSTIEGEDRTSLPLDQLQQGMRLKVHCISRLSQEVKGGGISQLMRAFVPGTLRCIDEAGDDLSVKIEGQTITIPEGGDRFLSYCPILEMCLTGIQAGTNEWSGKIKWQLDLEEI